ncbi:hypothetical protein K440DRAFT_595956 [Wilcoxina mikolae CBS 423.85]|nr:hypothetical protein K440DRAFT_595956 [Wilcoxina mikolae CBS 423.85]
MKRYIQEADGPVISPTPTTTSSTPLRLLSWNLRYDRISDTIPVSETISTLPTSIPSDDSIAYYTGFREAPWSTRRITIAREVAFNKPAVIGVQEALARQVSDLATLFGPDFAHIGVGREDGKEKGEFEAVYYRTSEVELVEWDTFWLSDTPFIPSKFPGAGSFRSATAARFRAKGGAEFTVLCTHWDERSNAQRRLAASLLLRRGAHEAATTGAPVFVLGDFNSPSTGEDSGGYEIMTGVLPPIAIDEEFAERYSCGKEGWVFRDLAVETAAIGRSGHHATFTGFEEHKRMELKRIDFVMAGGEGWGVERYRVGENLWDDQKMASDHRPVWVDVVVGE